VDEALQAAFLATDYRVRLPAGGWVCLRIGTPPPTALLQLTLGAPWGVITAWNPRSQPMPLAWNRRAQRSLIAELRAHSAVRAIRAAVGVGPGGWRESSLLVVGPEAAALHQLCVRYEQHAFIAGTAESPPRLHWTGAAP